MIYEPLQDLLRGLVRSENPYEDGGYSRLKVATALKFGIIGSDVYIKIGKDKFVRVLHKGSTIDASDIEKFKGKSVEFLYIENAGAKIALEEMISNVLHLSRLKAVDLKLSMETSSAAVEVIANFSATLGFTEEAKALTRESVKLTLRTIQQDALLSELFNRLKVNREGYLSSYSVILAHVACGIASLMGWNSESTFYKLSLAAFLHDITL